jgi:hypothetical protein
MRAETSYNADFYPEPKRLKLLLLDPGYVLFVFNQGLLKQSEGISFLKVPKPLGLPRSARVTAVHYDYSWASFVMVVEDDSFEEVPAGEMIPQIKVVWSLYEMAVKTVETPTGSWLKQGVNESEPPRAIINTSGLESSY